MGFVSRGIDGAFGAEQCSCEWTLFWACPDWGNVGINGRAEDDGSPCFHHCCDTPSPTDDPDTLPWSPDDGFKPGDLGGWTDPGFGSFEPGVNGLERPNLPLSKSCSCSWTLFYICVSVLAAQGSLRVRRERRLRLLQHLLWRRLGRPYRHEH